MKRFSFVAPLIVFKETSLEDYNIVLRSKDRDDFVYRQWHLGEIGFEVFFKQDTCVTYIKFTICLSKIFSTSLSAQTM